MSKKHKNQDSVHYSNVVDTLNDKYINWDCGTYHYPFSFVDNTMSQKIRVFGVYTLWDSEEGFPDHDKWPEGEELEKVLIEMCDEEFGKIINNIYGAYAKVHNRNFPTER